MSSSLATLVIGGYLGAGKTTLLNHMLREADGRRIAVLVNDFGDINIDADLIQGQYGEVMELSGGCVCCSFGADLVGALVSVAARKPQPDLILIETSGVALPGAVARSARLVPQLNVLGVVALLDAMTLRVLAQDRFVGGTVMQQIRDANLLVLNKVDLPSGAELQQVRHWLASLSTGAALIETQPSAMPADIFSLLGDDQLPSDEAWQPNGRLTSLRQSEASAQFESRSFQLATPVEVQVLRAELDNYPQILRAKGHILDSSGISWELQKVGSCSTLTRTSSPSMHPPSGQMVVITLKGRMPAHLLSNWNTGTMLK